MSIALLEQSLRAQRARPRCVRVNLRLWYALKTANLIAYRELPVAESGVRGPCLPHLGDVPLVLEPDLPAVAFAIDEAAAVVATIPSAQEPKPAPPPRSVVRRNESAFDRRWLGRY